MPSRDTKAAPPTGALVATKLAAAAILLFSSFVACAASVIKLAGTYSSIVFNEEGGDVLGYEVRIAPTARGFQAVVQVAEGAPGPLHVVDVIQTKDSIKFDIPLDGEVKGTFEGRVTASGLEGIISLPAGRVRVELKRTISYWER